MPLESFFAYYEYTYNLTYPSYFFDTAYVFFLSWGFLVTFSFFVSGFSFFLDSAFPTFIYSTFKAFCWWIYPWAKDDLFLVKAVDGGLTIYFF